MNFVQKKEVTNEDRTALKKANEEYTSCISKDFLQRFLNNEQVKVEDFCVAERQRMGELDTRIYGKLPF